MYVPKSFFWLKINWHWVKYHYWHDYCTTITTTNATCETGTSCLSVHPSSLSFFFVAFLFLNSKFFCVAFDRHLFGYYIFYPIYIYVFWLALWNFQTVCLFTIATSKLQEKQKRQIKPQKNQSKTKVKIQGVSADPQKEAADLFRESRVKHFRNLVVIPSLS